MTAQLSRIEQRGSRNRQISHRRRVAWREGAERKLDAQAEPTEAVPRLADSRGTPEAFGAVLLIGAPPRSRRVTPPSWRLPQPHCVRPTEAQSFLCSPLQRVGSMDETQRVVTAERLTRAEQELRASQRGLDGSPRARTRYAQAQAELEAAEAAGLLLLQLAAEPMDGIQTGRPG